MNATRPEANSEYSRGPDASTPAGRRLSGPGRGPREASTGAVGAAILAGGLLGALLLLVAEFTTLFEVKTAAGGVVVRSVGTGAHHSYALVPIALFVVFLSVAVWRAGSRPALLAIGLMGVVALLIALLGDLPDAHASGLVGNAATHFVSASSKPSAGLYMETLGAVVLIVTCVCGFLLLGPPPSSRSRKRSRSRSRSQDSGAERESVSEDRSVSERNARAAHHTGPGAAVGQPSHEEM